MADDWPWTVRTSTLYLILTSGIVFAGPVIWIAAADDDDMKVIANTVNLGGAVLTFAGLSYAYLRANSPWFQRMWARITGWPDHSARRRQLCGQRRHNRGRDTRIWFQRCGRPH